MSSCSGSSSDLEVSANETLGPSCTTKRPHKRLRTASKWSTDNIVVAPLLINPAQVRLSCLILSHFKRTNRRHVRHPHGTLINYNFNTGTGKHARRRSESYNHHRV